ncbi:MAG: PaaI family thioesterase [Deltaproteobacteria bacterium]
MPELNPKHVEAVLNMINQGYYFKHLSMVVKDMGIGYSLVELDIGDEHLNPFGGLHGGVYASAIDTAAYWAVYCELDEDAGYITIDLKVDYLAPVSVGKLIVKGRRIKVGKTMCLAEATAFDQTDKWLAHGTSKMMVTQGLQTIKNASDFIGTVDLPPKFI